MTSVLGGIKVVLSNKKALGVWAVVSLIILVVIILLEKAGTTLTLLQLENITFGQKITLALNYLLDFENTFTAGSLFLALAGSILGGLNITFSYLYLKTRSKLLHQSHLYTGTGLIFAFLGIGCAACGLALLNIILGTLGLSAVLGFLPFQGQELGYLGLVILAIATFALARKAGSPNIC